MAAINSNSLSGSIKFPVSLMGEMVMNGSYLIYVSSSSDKVRLEPTRAFRFNINSQDEALSFSAGLPLVFYSSVPSDTFTYTSGSAGPFVNTAANIVGMTGPNNVSTLTASAITSTELFNIWSLTNLTTFKCSGNTGLTYIGGMPASILTASVDNCNLTDLYSLAHTSIKKLNCSHNNLSTLDLPATMSPNGYIDCSYNLISSLSHVPSGSKVLYCNNNLLTSIAATLPNTLVTMSISNNPSMLSWTSNMPTSLTRFEAEGTPLISLPSIGSPLVYLNLKGCSLAAEAIDFICVSLVTNGALSGSLDIRNNSELSPATLANIATLRSRAWTVLS